MLPAGRVPPCSLVAAKRALVFFCATWLVRVRGLGLGLRLGFGLGSRLGSGSGLGSGFG